MRFYGDHLLYRQPGWPVADPDAVVAAAVARTARVRLGVLMAALARRRPAKGGPFDVALEGGRSRGPERSASRRTSRPG
jgi:hypothetical protein